MSERLLDFAAALNEVARVAIEQKVDAVVDTGDTFHSPDPDPFSVGAYRRFAEKLWNEDISLIGIIGNHNMHRVGQMAGCPTWMEAVGDYIIRPTCPEEPQVLMSRDRTCRLRFVSADWMPSDRVDTFLARIPQPHPIDALFMHQSCEGFMPVIARAEVKPSQFDGLARYVGIGDIHVTTKQQTAKGTLIGSPGSTELVSLGECLQKYVVLVEFPEKGELTWQTIPIETRPIRNFPMASSAELLSLNMTGLKTEFADVQSSSDQARPIVIQPYDHLIEREAMAAKRELTELGFKMLRFTPFNSGTSGTEFVDAVEKEQSAVMPEILSEILAKDPQSAYLVPVAQDLWKNPGNATAIIDALLEKIRQDATASVPAPSAA